jgi:hypothetical protein
MRRASRARSLTWVVGVEGGNGVGAGWGGKSSSSGSDRDAGERAGFCADGGGGAGVGGGGAGFGGGGQVGASLVPAPGRRGGRRVFQWGRPLTRLRRCGLGVALASAADGGAGSDAPTNDHPNLDTSRWRLHSLRSRRSRRPDHELGGACLRRLRRVKRVGRDGLAAAWERRCPRLSSRRRA